MPQERASKKQQELLSFVKEFIREHDYGPSYREIMRALDYKSVSTVAVHIDGLIAKGFLRRRDKSARSLEVVGTPQTTPLNQEISPTEVVEKELIKRWKAAELSENQKDLVVSALETLQFAALAKRLKEDES